MRKVLTHPGDNSFKGENDSFKEMAGNFNLPLNRGKQVVQQFEENIHSHLFFHSFYPSFFFLPTSIHQCTQSLSYLPVELYGGWTDHFRLSHVHNLSREFNGDHM